MAVKSLQVALVAAITLALAGFACSTTAPMQAAETTEQRAYAAYGTYVVYQEAAAELMVRSDVPDAAKRRIQQVDAEAKPIADALLTAVVEMTRVRDEYQAGVADSGALQTAADNVARWTAELLPVAQLFAEAVTEAGNR